MLIRLIVCAGLVLLVGGADAQDPQPVHPQFERARVEADRLIADAGVEDIFENATIRDSAIVRHRESGFRCVFIPGDATARIIVYETAQPRGDAVGCQMRKFDMDMTLSARREMNGLTAQSALNAAAESFRRDYPSAHAVPDAVEAEGVDGRVHISGIAVRHGTPDGPVDIHAATAAQDGWVYELRMTYGIKTTSPGEGASAALLGRLLFLGAVPHPGD